MSGRGGRLVAVGLTLSGLALAAPAAVKPQAVFARYVQTPVSRVSDLVVSGLDAGRPTLNFSLKGALALPADPRFVRGTYAQAYAATLDSPCRSVLNGNSRLKLERLAVPELDAGRLTVQNGTHYCLTLWNFKR